MLFIFYVAHAVEVSFVDEDAALFIVIHAPVNVGKGGQVLFEPVKGFIDCLVVSSRSGGAVTFTFAKFYVMIAAICFGKITESRAKAELSDQLSQSRMAFNDRVECIDRLEMMLMLFYGKPFVTLLVFIHK